MMTVVSGCEELQLLSAESAKDLGTGHINVLLLIISVGVAVDDEDGGKATSGVMPARTAARAVGQSGAS